MTCNWVSSDILPCHYIQNVHVQFIGKVAATYMYNVPVHHLSRARERSDFNQIDMISIFVIYHNIIMRGLGLYTIKLKLDLHTCSLFSIYNQSLIANCLPSGTINQPTENKDQVWRS
jgi:hypothetical protein